MEEEFLLVEADGRPRPLIEPLLSGLEDSADVVDGVGAAEAEHEFKQEQAEIASRPHQDLDALTADLITRRRALAVSVSALGASLCALGTSPIPVQPTTTDDDRYHRMARVYGLTAQEQLTCGCHVHVSVASRAEGVAVLNGISPWLPVLTALSVNSPFFQGVDTGYASYRRMMWNRWPVSGPVQSFSDPEEYDAAVRALVETGVLLDEGMVYFDARLSRRYPTVEIRVADVCTEPQDAALIAALCRGLVTTVAGEPQAAQPPRLDLVHGAAWRAARSGMSGDLVDIDAATAVPAWSLAGQLLELVSPALRATGDLDAVIAHLDRIRQRGTGADLQRSSYARRADPADVVADAVARTVA